ncbi:MAG: shikimate kinase [Lachnospiraceae bacterium]|nr:shikimate kinase [Lachnospiraceae bacterium]
MDHLLIEGFIGSGKGKAARAAAKEMGLTVVDLDRRISDRLKMTTAEIYDRFGEPYYRAMETLILSELTGSRKRSVIVLGSGVAMMPQNRVYLKELGRVYYLRISPDTVLTNMRAGKKHDWISDDSWEDKVMSIFREREPAYQETADETIDVDGKSAPEIAAMIIGLEQKYAENGG